jgi:hypothetical protein
MNKIIIRSYWFLMGLGLFLVAEGLLLSIKPVGASIQPIPVTNNRNLALPDWNQITFNSLPGIKQNGSFILPTNLISQLGYNPSRQWFAGQTPDQYLMLGDFQNALFLQEFNLTHISQRTGFNLSQLSLANFPLIGKQSIEDLTEAIPQLLTIPIGQIPPINDLIKTEINTYFSSNLTLGQLLNNLPQLAQLKLEELPLEDYAIGDIPFLEDTALKNFKYWQGEMISQIPGLGNVSFSQFPNPPQPQGAGVGLIDLAFSNAEKYANRAISGSYQAGFHVPCSGGCPHVELGGNPVINGTQWVSGQSQSVRGGEGILSAVNNGLEPTGRHPFGDAFKVVVWDTNEMTGSADTALFFRICQETAFVDLGCTPYFIGPIPFINYSETDPIFLGSRDEG